MYVQPLEGALGQASFPPVGEPGEGIGLPLPQPGLPFGLGTDGVSRLLPPLYGGAGMSNPMQTAMFGPLGGLLQQLMQLLQSLMGSSMPPLGTGMCPQPYGGEQYFSTANGGSEGDPHLSFNGNNWTSMTSQPNLLQSNSFPGGFQIATQVTPPNAQGVAWNQSATVTLDGGTTTVSMNDAGQPSIVAMGQPQAIAPGQTLPLGNGERVTYGGNGSLTIVANNGQGGQIATTLTARGPGVDVDVTARNVDLGGSLVERQPI